MPTQSVFLNCSHVWSGRCTKIDVLVPNWQTFRPKVQLFTQNSLPLARASNSKQQKRNRCTPHRPWRRSFWPNTTTNQQSRGTSLTSKMIANSPYDFIRIDCYLASSCIFLQFGRIAPPWPCWPWQLQFGDSSPSNPTKTAWIIY
jgi:hypothetical protein